MQISMQISWVLKDSKDQLQAFCFHNLAQHCFLFCGYPQEKIENKMQGCSLLSAKHTPSWGSWQNSAGPHFGNALTLVLYHNWCFRIDWELIVDTYLASKIVAAFVWYIHHDVVVYSSSASSRGCGAGLCFGVLLQAGVGWKAMMSKC